MISLLSSRRRERRLAILILMVAMALWLPWAVRADGTVYLYYFFDPGCSVCHEVHQEVIEPLQAEYGDRLVIEERSIAETANFELLLDLEMQQGVLAGSIPEVFIGEDALVGGDEIRAKLRERIEHYLAQGGVALPTVIASTTAVSTPTAGGEPCEECEIIHGAQRTAVAQKETATPAGPVVHVLLFWSETCPHCHKVLNEVLPPIQAHYGAQLQVHTVDVTIESNRELWRAARQELGVPPDQAFVPMLFVGKTVLIGSSPIEKHLPRLIEQHLATGGLDLPAVEGLTEETAPLYTPPAPAVGQAGGTIETVPAPTLTSAEPTAKPEGGATSQSPIIHAAFFYQPGCDACERSEHDLAYIQQKYPQVQIQRFNVKEETLLNQYLCKKAGVPEEKHLTAPAFFVGDKYLVGAQVRARAIEELIAPYLESGAPEPWSGFESAKVVAEQTIIERFRSLGLLTVVGAGLLDGINPCAFATMIFLISYLSLRKRQGSELLATGGAFTFGVFLTYLGVGFGFLKFLSNLPFLDIIGKWVYGLTAVLCLALAWGSLADYRKAREGRLEDMTLKLPDRMRGWTKTLIREGTGARRFVLSSFALGFGVSVIELACTGQVYLPTIIFVLGIPEWRTQASLALLLYNVMFILPLVIIFVTVYFGTSSEQLIEWMQKHSATVKLGMAVLFVLLAAWLVYSIVAL